MRAYSCATLCRLTIGFDRLLDLINRNASQPDWPPCDIEKVGETRYRTRMAVAGLSAQEVEITPPGNALIVAGQKTPEQDPQAMLPQGPAFGDFKRRVSLADQLIVASANLENGLLSIELFRGVPEELKPSVTKSAPASASAFRPRTSDRNWWLKARAPRPPKHVQNHTAGMAAGTIGGLYGEWK